MPQLIRVTKVVLAMVAGLTVLLLTALACAVLIIEPDTYRPALQRQLSAALGREIIIGRLEIGKSLYPTVAVAGLRVANPAWASRPNLLSVSSASARFDLVALVRGELEIGRIELQGLDLLLERDQDGAGNWKFASGASKPSRAEAAPLPGLDEVAIRDVQIGWRGPDGTVTEVRVESGNAKLAANKPLRIEARLAYRQMPIDVNLTASTSLDGALSGQPVSASVALRALDARANLEIATPRLFDLAGTSVNFAANGQQLDALSVLVDRPLPALGPYRVSGRTRFATGMMRLDNLRMSIDGLTDKTPLTLSRIEIDSGEVTLGPEITTTAQLAGRLDATRFDLDVTSATFDQLVNATDNIPLITAVMLDNFQLGAEGVIRRDEGSWAFELVTQAKGDVSKLAHVAGAGPFKQSLPVELSGRIEGNPTEIAATGLNGRIAQTSISGDIKLRPTTPLQLSGALDIGSVDLAAFEMIKDNSTPAPAPATRPQQGAPQWIDSIDADLRLRVERIVGLPMAATGMSGHATVKAGQLEVRKFRGSLADTLLFADAALQWRGSRPFIEASVTAPVVDIEMLGGKGNTASGKDRDSNDREPAILDAPIPAAQLRFADADVKLSVGEVTGAPVAVDRLRVSAQLERGRLRVPLLNAALAGVPVDSTLVLDASSDNAHLSANVSTRRVDLAKLADELKVDATLSGEIGQATATLDTRGTSLRRWVSNAKVVARVGASTIKQGGGDKELTLEQASAIAGPTVDTRAEMFGQFGKFPVKLVATGGKLAELLDDEPLWPNVTARLNTAFRKTPISLSGQSALHALLGGRNVPIRFLMRSSNGHALVAGTIADLREPARTPLDVEVSVKGEALKPLLRNEWVVPELPIKASAKASLDDGVVSLQRLRFRAGEADLSGDLRLQVKDRIRLTASFSGDTLDLRPWLPAPTQREPKRNSDASPKARASKLDRGFDLEGIREFDVALQLKLRRLISHRLDLDSPALKAELDGGRLDAAISIAEGNSSVGLQFDGSSDMALVVLRASMTDLNLETLKTGSTSLTDAPRFSAKLKFAGVGSTTREVYESAKGEALISAGPGQLRKGGRPFMVQVLSTDLVETLLPGRKPDDYTQMECAAVHFSVTDGVVSSPDGMAIRTKDVDILGSGAINLVTREILFGFRAVRRRWFSFSFLDIAGEFATIGGTLDKPTVGLDPGGTLVTGGAAWATAGLSLLATRFWRKLGAADDPCQVIIEKGRTKSDPLDALIKNLPADLLNSLPLPGRKQQQK